jgi:WD40 repeat protein
MEPLPKANFPPASRRFDWAAIGLAGWLIGGLYLDGWAHNHGMVDDVFFTPWHAVLYSGALALMLFLGLTMARNLARGYDWRRALPPGYLPSLIGAGIFGVGGALDLVWHELFGIEVDLETLLSPTHLVLALGGVLMASGPLRSAWARGGRDGAGIFEARGPNPQKGASEGLRGSWLALGPALIAAALFLSVLTFFTSYIHPLEGGYAAADASVRDAESELYLMNADGSAQTRLTVNPTGHSDFGAFSPDGRQVVFSGGEGEEWHLFIINADGSGRRALTSGDNADWAPTWSPDGEQIVFSTDRAGDDGQTLYSISPAGGEAQPLLPAGPANQGGAAFSPDGQRVSFCGSSSGLAFQWQLYVANVDGSGLAQLTQGDGCEPSWAPDSRQVAYHSCANNDCDIWTMDVDGVLAGADQPRQITRGPSFDWRPSWSPDGNTLVYSSEHGDSMDVYAIDALGASPPRNLTDNPALNSWTAAYSPDGTRLVVSANGHVASPAWATTSIGLAAVLMQAALLMGMVLPLARRFALPFGALTLIIGLNSLMMAVLSDRYLLALAAVGAGLLADSLAAWLRPHTASRGRFYAFAFSVPVAAYGLYFAALALTDGIAWTMHLWLGVIVCSGFMGLFVALVVLAAEGNGDTAEERSALKPVGS